MNPLYIFLERLTKKLELQADLDVVNKLLIVYFVNFTGIMRSIFFLPSLPLHPEIIHWLFSCFQLLLHLSSRLVFFHYTRQQNLSKIFLTLVTAVVFIYLLHTGGTEGSGHFWILLFPVFSIPLFGIRRGNVVSFLFFVVIVLYLVFQSRLNV